MLQLGRQRVDANPASDVGVDGGNQLTNNQVPYTEEVTPGELRHAMRGYGRMGYPVEGYTPMPNGLVTIVIMAPPNTTIPDWRTGAFAQPQAHRRSWPAFNWRAWVQVLCVLAIVGGIGYLVYSMAGSGDVKQPNVAAAVDDLRTMVRDFLEEEDAKPEPKPEPQTVEAPWWRFWNREPDVVQPQAEEKAPLDATEWTWPPKNPVGDAIDGMQQMVMLTIYLVLGLGLLFVFAVLVGGARRR